MNFEPIAIIDQALIDVELQSEQLSAMIAQLFLYNTPEHNRRSLTQEGFWERRHGERRVPQRATVGRRELLERRLLLHERIEEWHSELAQVLENSMKLYDLKRSFQS